VRSKKILPAVLLAALVAFFPVPASAEPDEETLESDLAEAIDKVADAEDAVDAANARAAALETQIGETQALFNELTADLHEYALYLHTEGDLQTTNAILSSEDSSDLVDAMTYTGFLGGERAALMNEAGTLLDELEAQQAAHADEIKAAEDALEDAEKAAEDLEEQLEDLRAEEASGPGSDGGAPAAGGFDGGGDGCTEDDPTTDGCLTPRTLHMYNETLEAGFDHYVSCYRSGGSGEHPLGRACDWAADESGFQNEDATGSDKDYGDQLASWYVNNADSLGVEYVIWYNEFWSSSSGWRSYTGGNGDPASDHTNHVHVSMR
jgi:septal ring factor EnvC (AmiA/AmiB activator)